MSLYEVLMTDHEEEILSHLTQLDYDNADIAKAYQFLPINQAVHKLGEENIETPVYVPAMIETRGGSTSRDRFLKPGKYRHVT